MPGAATATEEKEDRTEPTRDGYAEEASSEKSDPDDGALADDAAHGPPAKGVPSQPDGLAHLAPPDQPQPGLEGGASQPSSSEGAEDDERELHASSSTSNQLTPVELELKRELERQNQMQGCVHVAHVHEVS
jgi:hypothetical protein